MNNAFMGLSNAFMGPSNAFMGLSNAVSQSFFFDGRVFCVTIVTN
jgi:hypothetical protein